jgi:hypothetical protein
MGNESCPMTRPSWSVRRTPRYRGAPRWWWLRWMPAWHAGRGPYVSIGLGFFALYRGY